MSFVQRSRAALLLLSRVALYDIAAAAAAPARTVSASSLNKIRHRLFNYSTTARATRAATAILAHHRRRFASTPTTLIAAFGLSLHAMSAAADVHQKADELFDANRYDELLAYLLEQPSWHDNSELLWRVARARFQLSKSESDTTKKTEMVKMAYDNVRRSLELNDDCGPAHKVHERRELFNDLLLTRDGHFFILSVGCDSSGSVVELRRHQGAHRANVQCA